MQTPSKTKENLMINQLNIVEKLGEGSFGSVFKGKSVTSRKEFAIKLEKLDYSQNKS